MKTWLYIALGLILGSRSLAVFAEAPAIYADIAEARDGWQWTSLNTRNGVVRLDQPLQMANREVNSMCVGLFLGALDAGCAKNNKLDDFVDTQPGPITLATPVLWAATPLMVLGAFKDRKYLFAPLFVLTLPVLLEGEFDHAKWEDAVRSANANAAQTQPVNITLQKLNQLSRPDFQLPPLEKSYYGQLMAEISRAETEVSGLLEQQVRQRLKIQVSGVEFSHSKKESELTAALRNSILVNVTSDLTFPFLGEPTPAPETFSIGVAKELNRIQRSDWPSFVARINELETKLRNQTDEAREQILAINARRLEENAQYRIALENYHQTLRKAPKIVTLEWPGQIPELAGLEYSIEAPVERWITLGMTFQSEVAVKLLIQDSSEPLAAY